MTARGIIVIVSGVASLGGAAVSCGTYLAANVLETKANKLMGDIADSNEESRYIPPKAEKLLNRAKTLKKISDISGAVSICGSVTSFGCDMANHVNKMKTLTNNNVPKTE